MYKGTIYNFPTFLSHSVFLPLQTHCSSPFYSSLLLPCDDEKLLVRKKIRKEIKCLMAFAEISLFSFSCYQRKEEEEKRKNTGKNRALVKCEYFVFSVISFLIFFSLLVFFFSLSRSGYRCVYACVCARLSRTYSKRH